MSLQDMTVDEVIASIHNALEQELQKQHPQSPVYHSGHIALAYKLGKKDTEQRIIKLLESKDYRGNGPTFTLDELKRLIKGEQK